MIDADAGELYAAWRGAEARIDAAKAVMVTYLEHGPTGLGPGGSMAFLDIARALDGDTQYLTQPQKPPRERETE